MRRSLLTLIALAALGCAQAAPAPAGMAQILARAPAADWRTLDPAHLLVMRLPQGRVVIELAPAFAPAHVADIEALARAHYWDGLAITRVQDDFVAQWGDPAADTPRRRALPAGLSRALPAEYTRALAGLHFTRLPDGDVYAPAVGFADGFPVGADPAAGRAWLLHCYGMVGVGRDNPPDTGNGTELYAVIGQAPRQLDRNIALVGRVADLIEIAGKRASLADLTRQLLAIPGVQDAALIQHDAPDAAGARRLAALVVAPTRSETELLAELRQRFDPVFLPRPLKRVERLPRNALGKLPHTAVWALLRA
ncbi:peptidylprolyl isomerase [Metallibacterium sp.]|uniref:peptidylprolyl isomerase n=1 Tax=Metallibacterium sp. TaxID=2940281 RepID=UPI0031BB5EF3